MTWTVRNVSDVPGKVDLEIPLRRKYAGKPHEWDNVKVTTKKQSLGTASTDYHSLTLQNVWWQKQGTTAWTTDRRSGNYLRSPCICIERAFKQTKPSPDPVVNFHFEAFTAAGQSLAYRGGGGSGGFSISRFRCPRRQTVRLKWTPIHARDTGKKFVFSAITPQPLVVKR